MSVYCIDASYLTRRITAMDELISEQVFALEKLTRSFTNLKKKGGWRTKGNIKSRLKFLEEKWDQIKQRHETIVSNATASDKKKSYFAADFIENASESFIDERAQFLDALDELETDRIISDPPRSPVGTVPKPRKLPAIPLPSFSGKYTEWTSFKSRFTSLMATYGIA